MIWVKRLVIVLVLVVIGFLGWSWQYGPMRVKRDISAFAMNMESCTPYNQDFKDPLSGKIMNRAVIDPEDDTCEIRMQTYSPEVLHCVFAMEDMPELAAAFAAHADNIGFFGGMHIKIDTNSPDPLQRAMNSPDCTLTKG